ncbi:Arylesterase [bioreactor metagenome]|uniref:Arylesterase n=1 Tax=bioreactor metagenome TaxID=1076179 RepID=A0A645H8X8_9ZZZZ
MEGRLWILADSISSGIGFDGERVWSRLLEEEHPDRIRNRAVPGGKVSNSLPVLQKQFEFLPGDALLIELGGNDMLSGEPAAEFRKNLDELLATVAAAKIPAVMMELPLPPFRADYLRVQREAAKRYGIRLIPRRRFAAVLSGSESTVDGVHLSNFGHRKMAETVRRAFVFK